MAKMALKTHGITKPMVFVIGLALLVIIIPVQGFSENFVSTGLGYGAYAARYHQNNIDQELKFGSLGVNLNFAHYFNDTVGLFFNPTIYFPSKITLSYSTNTAEADIDSSIVAGVLLGATFRIPFSELLSLQLGIGPSLILGELKNSESNKTFLTSFGISANVAGEYKLDKNFNLLMGIKLDIHFMEAWGEEYNGERQESELDNFLLSDFTPFINVGYTF